jgi:hypothetical protein
MLLLEVKLPQGEVGESEVRSQRDGPPEVSLRLRVTVQLPLEITEVVVDRRVIGGEREGFPEPFESLVHLDLADVDDPELGVRLGVPGLDGDHLLERGDRFPVTAPGVADFRHAEVTAHGARRHLCLTPEMPERRLMLSLG